MSGLSAALLIAALGATSPPQHPAVTPAQWREDLRVLVAELKAVHPGPFHATSQARFDSAVAKLNRDLPTLSANQSLVRMLGVVALVKDGHTRFALPQSGSVFPLRIYRYADGIFVTAVRPEDRAILDARIVRIDGRDAAAVYDSIQKIVPGDNIFSQMEGVPRYFTSPEIMDGLGLARKSQLVLDLVTNAGTSVTKTISAIPETPDPLAWILGKRGPGGASLTSVSRLDDHADLPYRYSGVAYRLDRDSDVLYAKFDIVQDSPDSVVVMGQRVKEGFAQFGARLTQLLDTASARILVIDLRDNGGGNNALAKPIVAGIAASKYNTKGRLFVITGRRTYSAAMNFTSMFEDQTHAIFVGEAPGGSPAHVGDNTPFVLPNSKLTVSISTLNWAIGVAPTDVRHVMEPDIWAPPLHADAIRGVDAAMNAIRSYSDSSVLSDRLLAALKQGGVQAAKATYSQHRSTLPAPWNSDVQQLIQFGWSSPRSQMLDAFAFVTDAYPQSSQAWFERARLLTFAGDWKGVEAALTKASRLDPQNTLIRRFLANAKYKQR